jgi:hypothetical protein
VVKRAEECVKECEVVEFRENVDEDSVELATELETDVIVAEDRESGVEIGVFEVSEG